MVYIITIKKLSKLNNESNSRHNQLDDVILGIISSEPGISHNELLKEIIKKKTSSRSTIQKAIRNLLGINSLIEYKQERRKYHYYIKGQLKSFPNPKKLIKKVSELKKIIDDAEQISLSYDKYGKEGLYDMLEDMISSLNRLNSYHKMNKQNTPFELEDDLIESIKEYSEYEIEGIQSDISKAMKIYNVIKKSRKNISIKFYKNKQKKIKNPQIAETLNLINEKIENLKKLLDRLDRTKSYNQERLFILELHTMRTPNEIVKILQDLNKIKIFLQKNNISDLNNNLCSILRYFCKQLNPIKKDKLIDKLVSTKKFKEKDVLDLIFNQSLHNRIIHDKNDIYYLNC